MSTEHVREQLEAYLDGELNDARRGRVDQHVRACSACRAELDELRSLHAALVGLPVPDPGPDYWTGFAARVEERLSPVPSPARRYERLSGWLFPSGGLAWARAAGAVATLTALTYLGLRGFRAADTQVRSPVRVQEAAPQSEAPGEPSGGPAPAELAPEPPAAPPPPGEPQAAPSDGVIEVHEPPTGAMQARESAAVNKEAGPGAPEAREPEAARDADAGRAPAVAARPAPARPVPVPEPAPAGPTPAAPLAAAPPAQASAPAQPAPAPSAPAAPLAGAPTPASPAPLQDVRGRFAVPPPQGSAPSRATTPLPPQPVETEALRSEKGRAQVSSPIARVDAPKGAGTWADRSVGPRGVSGAPAEDRVARFVDAAVAGDTSSARDAFAQLEVDSGPDVAPEARDAMRRWLAASGPASSGPTPPRAGRRRIQVLQSAPGDAPARANLDGLLALDDLVWSRRGEPRYDDAVRGLARQFAARAADPRAAARARDYLQWLVAHSTDDSERDAWRRMLEALPR